MTLQIYGDRISGNCLKVKWTAEKLGIPYRWIQTSVLDAETRTEAFLAINPFGQVPFVRLEDGRGLGQSNAIIVHLAEGSDLIPDDPYERAKMLEWLFWEQYSHEPNIAVVRFHRALLGKPASEIDPRLMERGHRALALMQQHLIGTPFMVGQALTLADVALVAYTRVAHEGDFDLAQYPAVQAWVTRVEAALGITD